jgi:hypothetical protein
MNLRKDHAEGSISSGSVKNGFKERRALLFQDIMRACNPKEVLQSLLKTNQHFHHGI